MKYKIARVICPAYPMILREILKRLENLHGTIKVELTEKYVVLVGE